jgi:predicted acetyltransferase
MGMAMTLRWVDENDFDRVARTRMYCYKTAENQLDQYMKNLREDKRPGEYLLAERDGVAVGTATSLAMSMWIRGNKIPCQGVAWVGTIKTHRRRGGEDRGVASQIMAATLNRARERGQIVSALMPFRASYYGHFGYGIVERRNVWTVPLSILPHGDFAGVRFMQREDLPLIKKCRQRMEEQGQCAIERTDQSWDRLVSQWGEGYGIVDQPTSSGPITSWLDLLEVDKEGRKSIQVFDAAWDSPESFLRQLYFLATLRDQFGEVTLALPADLPLDRLLKEPQLPHRLVEHVTATVAPQTRMAVRVLDHVKFLEAIKLPVNVSGKTTIEIRECEGNVSTIQIECDAGHITAKPQSGKAEVQCDDKIWSVIACGEMKASSAARFGLIHVTEPVALKLLDALSIGPAPFCNEYF